MVEREGPEITNTWLKTGYSHLTGMMGLYFIRCTICQGKQHQYAFVKTPQLSRPAENPISAIICSRANSNILNNLGHAYFAMPSVMLFTTFVTVVVVATH